VLVGQRKALAIAVKGDRKRRRWSKLREWLALNAKASPVLVTLFTRSGCYAGLSLARLLIGRKDLTIVFWSPVSLKRQFRTSAASQRLTIMVNSQYNGWRMEAVWLDR